jgi:hypothetical protein
MNGTGETTIRVTDLHAVGRGVDRPEQVVVAGDGRVFASDKASSQNSLMRTPFGVWGRWAASRAGSRSTATATF